MRDMFMVGDMRGSEDVREKMVQARGVYNSL